MPRQQTLLYQLSQQALAAALALAALHHLAVPLPTAEATYQEDNQDYGHQDHQAVPPDTYQLPVLRTRPLVPAIDLSSYTYM